ncbi:MAG: dsDNA nuclease domain-containing protein [Candidatus Melainabacteria bacterium]|nr:dsDNA nuclease domain-containing protein [Candidatus Melainabacteria bacterium]
MSSFKVLCHHYFPTSFFYLGVLVSATSRSIHEKQPRNSGGTDAAQGYLFQHHVSISFILDMLTNPALQTIYVETHDDVTAIHSDNKAELIQVKTTDKEQFWSIAMLSESKSDKQGKKKPNSSMLHTSLAGDEFDEKAIFRIVTSVDAKKELGPLKLKRDHVKRSARDETFKALIDTLHAKLDGFQSDNKNGAEYWALNTLWDFRGTREAVENDNGTKLRKLLETMGEQLPFDQERKIYEALLAQVFNAAAANFNLRLDQKRFEKPAIQSWLENEARNITLSAPAMSSKLQEKLNKAKITNEDQYSAFRARMAYRKATFDQQYMALKSWEPMQFEVETRLAALRARMDTGQEPEGMLFLTKCFDELKDIKQCLPDHLHDHILHGYMYDLASRCLHRFTKVV